MKRREEKEGENEEGGRGDNRGRGKTTKMQVIVLYTDTSCETPYLFLHYIVYLKPTIKRGKA
jgi:hypothetical protein